MRENMTEGLTFDDVLLLPGYTDFKRQDADLTTRLHPAVILKLPVISSPMDTVTESAMARSLAVAGGLGIIHRNLSIETQAEMIEKVKADRLLVGAAVGVGNDLEERVRALVAAGADVLVVDSGHGYTKFVIEATTRIKKNYPAVVVMAGNVATYEGAKALIAAGADILRVGMGPGSICTTRIVTGMGVPQLTAIAEATRAARVLQSRIQLRGTMKAKQITIIADGGIRQVGDMAKAIAAGAQAVMLGSLLAGFDESPGKIVDIGGKKYKEYRGMGSVAAMQKGSAERYGQSRETKGRKLIAEGVEGLVSYKGTVSDYLDQIAGSLKSSFYYIGGKTISDFQKKARFIRITPASMAESHPHSITITDAGKNYQL